MARNNPHEACCYSVLPQETGAKKLRCDLCPHHCILTDGKTGICLVRSNTGGVLYTLNYCRPVSVAIDPIEKKPLYHFYPGSSIYSTGPCGCTFKCLFCQNCGISQEFIDAKEIPYADLAQDVIQSRTIGIAYTYSEPYTWFETIMEVAPLIREKGLKNVMVTNGFMEPDPLSRLLEFIDAMNIDIKSIRPGFYRRLCKARLEPVLRSCEQAKKQCHIEITNLLIPEENDSEKDIKDLVDYIASNLGNDTPLHFSRYFPRHKLDLPPTPSSTLRLAKEIASDKLDYVYVGNIEMEDCSNTYCPSCKTLLIKRCGYDVSIETSLERNPATAMGMCGNCHFQTNIVIG
jgi:pyruvate formate lyase activating enzyme